ncbi:MAG TPA: hypothetical protein PLY23_07735, partial [Alphaproteobacteria bacterium]|nr:hypothetical protein [Alphaproteobacteria bacterium]
GGIAIHYRLITRRYGEDTKISYISFVTLAVGIISFPYLLEAKSTLSDCKKLETQLREHGNIPHGKGWRLGSVQYEEHTKKFDKLFAHFEKECQHFPDFPEFLTAAQRKAIEDEK